jgi:hypothetical protein
MGVALSASLDIPRRFCHRTAMTSLLITGADVKRLTFGMMVLAATVLAGMAEAEQDKAEPPLRLELSLVDGSRIIGAPSIEAIPVETSYANMSEHPQNNEYAMIAWGSQSRGKLAEAGLRWEDNTFQFHYAGDNSPRTADRKDDGQWHFGTITYDGRTAKVYIDSQLADSREEILNIGPGTTSVGYRKAYGDCYYDGLLDEVRVYSRALTADEIKLLYDAEK